MHRTIVFAICMFTLIMAQISSASAFEMEGTVDAVPAKRAVPRHVPSTAIAELPDTWNCEKPEGIVRIRSAAFCRVMVDGAAPAIKRAPGLVRYRVLIEKGLEEQADGFITRVETILGGNSGWTRNGLRFVRVVEDYDITLLLAAPKSVDLLCRPLRTDGWLSCGFARRAIINATRWRDGATTWGDDIAGYHHYLINHEVGHLLGLRHASCPEEGTPAPIMVQQTISLEGCTANGSATPGDLAMLTRAMPYLERRLSGIYPKRTRRYKRRVRRRARWSRSRRARSRRISRQRVSRRRASRRRSSRRRKGRLTRQRAFARASRRALGGNQAR